MDKVKECSQNNITFGQWKRVAVDDKGKRKMIMKVVTATMTMADFLENMQLQVQEFAEHVQRVRRQHEECLKIKQNLPLNEVVINMDFAENYACKSVEEIQSAYWNMSAVTLHPIVVYYKEDSEILKHKSIVMVSDEMAHNSTTVLTFLDKVIPEIKKIVPTVQKVHYFTDSPTSQYRNKTIFRVVSNHDVIYGCSAIWSYYEAGHGKGPCDGLGGTVKRMADEAVKAGKKDKKIQQLEEKLRQAERELQLMEEIRTSTQTKKYSKKLKEPLELELRIQVLKSTTEAFEQVNQLIFRHARHYNSNTSDVATHSTDLSKIVQRLLSYIYKVEDTKIGRVEYSGSSVDLKIQCFSCKAIGQMLELINGTEFQEVKFELRKYLEMEGGAEKSYEVVVKCFSQSLDDTRTQLHKRGLIVKKREGVSFPNPFHRRSNTYNLQKERP